MKLFNVAQNIFSSVGISPIKIDENSFNHRNLGVSLIFGLFTTSAAAAMLFDANTMQQYSESFFSLLSASFAFTLFIYSIQNTFAMSQLIKKNEQTIETRKKSAFFFNLQRHCENTF